MARRFKGNAPKDSFVLASTEYRGTKWNLYVRPEQSNDEFWSLKLAAAGRVELKANFWLGWAREENRLTRGKPGAILEERAPMLAQWVTDVMTPTGELADESDRLAEYVDAESALELWKLGAWA